MRVVVGMSGGVDSSVAAALLVEAGHDVIGVTLGLRPDHDAAALAQARSVCESLAIPHEFRAHATDFERLVITPFVDEYARGRTPNPCIVCNDRVKFATLLAYADEFGADAVASGHYATIERDPAGDSWLARGKDRSKDQSYFLYRLTTETLHRTIFPLGDLTKSQVRALAAEKGLECAARPESQEACFVDAGKHAALVASRVPSADLPGDIVDAGGMRLGRHRGLAHYTVGQRKGLGIAGPEPLYVVAVDARANRIVVGTLQDLEVTEIEAHDVVWRGGADSLNVLVQTRYRMEPVPAEARFAEGTLSISTSVPLVGAAAGQAVVCYLDERVVGGGPVRCTR